MKTAFILSTLFASAAAFGVAPLSSSVKSSSSTTALAGMVSESEMTSDQREIMKISKKWNEVRLLSKEEAEKLDDPEWKEAYNRFHEKYDSDMEKMQEIAGKLKKLIEPPKIEKKTKGQRKRDAWAKVQAREAARAAAKK